MRAVTLVRYGLGLLLALQLGTAFAGVALLARMAPAVERIIQENTRSLEATERMLAALSARDAQAFDRALGEARANVTEDGEGRVLAAIGEHRERALAGDPVAAAVLRERCLELARVNHAAMAEADAEARRLGNAGAVTMVLLGLGGLLTATAVSRRLQRVVVQPLEDFAAALRQVTAGDGLRRCAVPREAVEVAIAAAGINDVLDAHADRPDPGRDPGRPARSAALGTLLAGLGPMAVLVAPDGEILEATPPARDALLGPEGADLRAAIEARDSARVMDVRELPGGTGAILVLGPLPAPASPPDAPVEA